ncbi:MAG: DJ-1/PfpI family protein [Candidatus Eisenbacteria bacterium]|nr:DJ-1/PfpI family protein [Candidatus Eisenbacteria bacterium]
MIKRNTGREVFVAFAVTSALTLASSAAMVAPSRAATEGRADGDSRAAQPTLAHVASLPRTPGVEIPVALVIGADAEVLDFTGPLEVFAAAWTPEGKPLFKPYFVAGESEPVLVGGNMRVVPDYTFANAPAPKVIVIPAMSEHNPEMVDWIRRAAAGTDVTMSVCNGAFVLARTGLLDGRPATAHHGGYFRFAGAFPEVQLQRGARYVETGNLASSGGISSGIDLALRVVARYLGEAEAHAIVDAMEYQSSGWLDPGSNATYARLPESSAQSPICPLCQMTASTDIRSEYRGRTYYFCAESEKEYFDAHPEVVDRFLEEDAARGSESRRQ